MIWLVRFIIGYVRFSYSKGFAESFINECFERGLSVRSIEQTADGISAECRISVYKRLHSVALKTGGVVRVTERHGLPFLTKGLKNRAGFFVGAVVCCFIISLLTGFVWQVEIVGADSVSESMLAAYLEENGLSSGVMWSSVDRREICAGIMRDFDGVSWAHINRFGALARLEINEARPKPRPDTDKLKGKKIYRRELTVTAQREQSDLALVGTSEYVDLSFYWFRIPLYFGKQAGDITETERRFVRLNGVELPIGYTKTVAKRLGSVKHEVSDKELRAIAEKKLLHAEEQELDGFVIINKSVKEKMTESEIVLTGAYILKEKGTD